MTTYTLTGGIAVLRNPFGDDVIAVENGVELELVVPDGVTTFDYSLRPLRPGEHFQFGEIEIDDYNARVDGIELNDDFLSEEQTFIEVTWTDTLGVARTTTVLNLWFDNTEIELGFNGVDLFFHVSGYPLPSINSVAEWNAFEASVSALSNPSGTYDPGVIPLTALGGTVSEDDLINGTPDDDSFLGGEGNDTISGFEGDDRLEGEEGSDVLNGGAGNDWLVGGWGDDTIRTGDNDYEDAVYAGNGNDRVELTGISTGFVWLGHSDLTVGITVDLDSEANTLSIGKSFRGTTTVIDVDNALYADGLGIGGSDQDDTFNLDLDGGWMMVRGSAGDDVFNISGTVGGLRLDYRDALTGITADLAARTIADDGEGGSDTITGPGAPTELRASMHDDDVTGSWRDESFILMAGDDTLDGRGGDDTLWGGNGADSLLGGDDNDDMTGGAGNDTLRGENGNDSVDGGEGDDVVAGNDGNDTLDGRDGNDSLYGGNGNDLLRGLDGDDLLGAANGNDTVYGGNGNDTAYGGNGNDLIGGVDGNDRLFGNRGNDNVYGGNGDDSIGGGFGNDRVFSGHGNDVLYGGSGNDSMGGATGDDLLWANEGDDVLYGGSGDDTLRGGDGDDRFFAGTGDDEVMGQAGDDTLNGFDGSDTLNGGAGDDQMNGGSGIDTFVFSAGNDVIMDFFAGPEQDLIDLSGVASITDFTDLIDNHTSFDGNIVITDDAGNTLRLNGTTPISALTEDMFIF